jgi:putative membrane protein
MNRDARSAVLGAVIVVWVAALIASGIAPYDRLTWFMEAAPVLIVMPLLLATRRRLPLTTLLYVLVCIHGLILIYGAAYTYARTPLGFELQALLGFERNPYDRVGHFAQGFVPAIVARELLIRVFLLKPGGLMLFLVTCIALAISAFYELIEWWSALVMGQAADEFLGTQGDPWDTQWDMFLALVGALMAQFTLARWHDRQIASA